MPTPYTSLFSLTRILGLLHLLGFAGFGFPSGKLPQPRGKKIANETRGCCVGPAGAYPSPSPPSQSPYFVPPWPLLSLRAVMLALDCLHHAPLPLRAVVLALCCLHHVVRRVALK